MSQLYSPTFPVYVSGIGPVPCELMIIGEAPGRKEIEECEPFIGASGKVLNEALANAGSKREECYITNVFKGDVGDNNRNPTPEEVVDHGPILMAELFNVQPRRILLLGRFAVRTFLPETERMADVVGKRGSIGSYNVYPCWHPAYTLYNRKSREQFFDIVRVFVNDV